MNQSATLSGPAAEEDDSTDPSRAGVVALEVRDAYKVFRKGGGPLSRIRRNGEPRKTVVAVDRMSLSVRKGEVFGILGPNGTGKSTLIRLISTLLIPDGGSIRVFGRDVIEDEAEVKRMINRVSVEASFFKKLSPMENLIYGARLYRVDADEARVRINEILGRLGIERHSINSSMEDMSRGMQQKVAIARAFLTSPILLLLDEPTTGLDPHSKREVQAFVREIRDNHEATVLLTTHDMQEADELCDRIAIIDQGRIVAMDTPAALKRSVATEGQPNPSLEEVFLQLTGKKFEDADKEETP